MFSDGKMKMYSLCTGYFNVQAHSFWCDHVGLKSGELSGSTGEYTLKKLNFVWTHREGESPEDFVAKQPVSEVWP